MHPANKLPSAIASATQAVKSVSVKPPRIARRDNETALFIMFLVSFSALALRNLPRAARAAREPRPILRQIAALSSARRKLKSLLFRIWQQFGDSPFERGERVRFQREIGRLIRKLVLDD